MKEKVPYVVAQSEVTAWLDYKRVKPHQREKMQLSIDHITECVQYGIVSIDESTFEITQTLEFPVDNLLDKITYKPRISVAELNKVIKSASMADATLGSLAAITGQGVTVLSRMDSEDMKVAQAIVGFF